MGVYPEGQVAPLTNLLNGGPASKTSLTGVDDDAEYAVTLENQGTGGHLNIPGILAATSSGVTIPTLSVTTLTATTANITTANVGTLNVSGNSNLGDAVGDTTTISGNATVGQDLTVTRHATVNGNTALGNADADTLTVIAASTFRNAAAAVQLFVDAANNRVIVGSVTALSGAADDKLSVVGGALHVAANTSDVALGLRRTAATAGWTVGVEATQDLIFKDDAGTSILRIGDAASTYQLDVLSGDFHVADDAVIAGDISSSRSVVGGTTFSGTEELRVVGQSRLEGELTVTTGNVTVSAGNVTVSAGDVNVTGDVIASDEMQCGSSIAVGGQVISSSTGAFLSLTGSSQWQTTVGGSGGASGLPALPAVYIKFQLAGSDYVFAAYPAS